MGSLKSRTVNSEPEPFRRQIELPGDSPADTAQARRIIRVLAMILVSAGAGVAMIHIKPLLVIGFLLSGLIVAMVMSNPYSGLLIYTCIFLLRPGELYPALSPLHLERVVGALALLGMLFAQQRKQGRVFIDGTRQTLLLFAFFAAALLSVPFAYWRAEAMSGVGDVLKIVVFYILVVHLVDTRKRLRTFIWLYCALTAYIAASAFIPYLRGSSFYAQGIDRAVGATSEANNPNQLGTSMAAAIPLFLLIAIRGPFSWRRVLLAVGTLLLLATLAVTGSRASLLGLLAGMTYLWWRSKRRIIVGILGAALVCAGLLVLPEQYKTRYSTITQAKLDGSSLGRLDAWRAGLRMVMDRPFFGVGINCFGTAHGMGYSQGKRQNWLSAHSLYIQVLAELGIVGAAVFFSLLIEFLRLNRRTARRLKSAGGMWQFESLLLDGLFAGFMVLLVSGVFGHSLLRRTWYIYGGIGLSVLRLYLGQRETREAVPTRS